MVGGVVAVAVFGLIGVGLSALLREQVTTVVGLLIYLYVVEPIITGSQRCRMSRCTYPALRVAR